MAENTDNRLPQYLADKRVELIWALDLQDYSHSDIAKIFGLNQSSVFRIVDKKPRGWQPKWIKKT